jgi:serine protease
MNVSRGLISAALALGLIAVNVAPASAAVDPLLADSSTMASGLIVKYKDEVAPLAADGQPTAENAAGVNLIAGRDLGAGWRSVSFDESISAGAANSIALRLASDPRVSAVEIDRILKPTALSARLTPAQLAAALSALKPASPVRALRASDGWKKSAPGVAAVKLNWLAPTSLFGASVSGYRIEANRGSGWKFLASALTTSASISQGLSAGVRYSFRVAAITKLGGVAKLGSFSSMSSAMPTATPSAPIFSGANAAFGDSSSTWSSQSLSESGGLPIIGYQAIASATGETSVICNAPATATTCQFSGLTPNVTYSVSLVARNAHGKTASAASVTPQDSKFKDQWYLSSKYGVNVQKAWSKTMGAKSVVVAVIDSGITAHPDLDNQVIAGYDFVSDPSSSNDGDGWDSNNADPGDYVGAESSSWHGTHVAGIIAAQSNAIGVTGIAPNVRIQPIRALGSDGGNSSDLIAALHWAAGIHVDGVPDNKTPAQVVNLSMGTDSNTPCRSYGQTTGPTEAALAELKDKGVTVVSAAGNFNSPAYQSYPGNCYPTINVGATAYSGDRASYSNYSVLDTAGQMNGVDISAPGGDSKFPGDSPAGTNGKIVSTMNDGTKGPGSPIYAGEEGTSMAAPIVSGVVALIYSLKPTVSFEKVWEILKSTVTPFPAGSSCALKGNCGAGIVNAGAAIAAVEAAP